MWRDGLWLKLWDMGVKAEMWRAIKYGAPFVSILIKREGFVNTQGDI